MKTTKPNSNEKIQPAKATQKVQKPNLHDIEWMNNYEELKEFRQTFGHTYVRKYWPSIGNWVRYQRVLNKKGTLRPDRKKLLEQIDKKLLEDIDFSSDHFECGWDESFEAIREKSERVKHCDIPHKNTDVNETNTIFAENMKWAKEQRIQYANLINGFHSTLNQRRVEKLNSIGFTWKVEQVQTLVQSSEISRLNRKMRHSSYKIREEIEKAKKIHQETGDFVIPLPFGKATVSIEPDGSFGLQDLLLGDGEKKIVAFGIYKEGVNARFSTPPEYNMRARIEGT